MKLSVTLKELKPAFEGILSQADIISSSTSSSKLTFVETLQKQHHDRLSF